MLIVSAFPSFLHQHQAYFIAIIEYQCYILSHSVVLELENYPLYILSQGLKPVG
jgi:hypothetical protein